MLPPSRDHKALLYLALTSFPLLQPQWLPHPGTFAHAVLPGPDCSSDLCPSFHLAALPPPKTSSRALTPISVMGQSSPRLPSFRLGSWPPDFSLSPKSSALANPIWKQQLLSPMLPVGFKYRASCLPADQPRGPARTPASLLRLCRLSPGPQLPNLAPL